MIEPATTDIAELLPHAAPMILIESLLEAGENYLACRTKSHLSPDNPLRIDGILNIFSGIEYAAQAMALHARLSSAPGQEAEQPPRGFVATVSKVQAFAHRLDEYEQPLTIRVDQIACSRDSSLYTFTLSAGAAQLLEGQLMAVLEQH